MVREFLNNLVHLVTPMHDNELLVLFWYFIVVAWYSLYEIPYSGGVDDIVVLEGAIMLFRRFFI